MTTHSTARSLDQVRLSFHAEPSNERGPVRVVDTHPLRLRRRRTATSRSAPPATPGPTRATRWRSRRSPPWQPPRSTSSGCASSPSSTPTTGTSRRAIPFEGTPPSGWDFTRFNPAFFRHLERRVGQLRDLGIEADLILFHPYDRWGFDRTWVRPSTTATSATWSRRLAAYRNVWWSLANEYDFIWTKDLNDWERIAAVIKQEDHADHLTSIHNGLYLYDFSADWATHCSIQKTDERVADIVTDWRRTWGKPVVFDEPGYEGNLEYDWGNLTAQELTRRFWEASVRGGYMTHGETYWSADDRIFWSKGGRLVGESVERIAFLARIIADSPTHRLDSITTGLVGTSGGAPGRYEVHYFGPLQPRTKTVPVPAGAQAHIDVIDTWAMTIDTLPGSHHGEVTVPLPSKPYMAVRVRVLPADQGHQAAPVGC